MVRFLGRGEIDIQNVKQINEKANSIHWQAYLYDTIIHSFVLVIHLLWEQWDKCTNQTTLQRYFPIVAFQLVNLCWVPGMVLKVYTLHYLILR